MAITQSFVTQGKVHLVHRYTDFEQIVQEVIDARVWGGAHWRSSDTMGVEFGNRLAEYVIAGRGQ